jgi:hypothetical protein
VNLDPHELALWDRTKARFRGTPEQRLTAFREYVHEHPGEVYESLERVSEKKIRGLLKAQARGVSVSVPCEPPYRFRVKDRCAAMGRTNPKRRKKARRRNAGGLFESKADRERRLSDERARKRLEAPSRRTRKGDRTRGEHTKYQRKKKRKNEAGDPRAVELFRRLHWDVPPRSLVPKQMWAAKLKGPYAVLGQLHKIEYVTAKGKDGRSIYVHTFKGGTVLVVNGEGELLIAKTSRTGGYKVDDRGIVG